MANIPHKLLESAYAVAKDVHSKQKSFSAGVKQLATEGMNASSAADAIRDLKQMLNGAVYKRALNQYATDYFLTNIERDFGQESLRAALQSIELHLGYWNKLGKGRQRAIEALVAKRRAALTPQAHRPQLASTLADIRGNLLALERYRQSNDPAQRAAFAELIKNGLCFVAYGLKGRILFGPSRFIGYAGNSLREHALNGDKDGRQTNAAIEKVVGAEFGANAELEAAFLDFCRLHGIEPQARVRKFLRGGELPDEELLVDDIREIESRRDIKETEKKRLVDARVGQGWFRDALLKIWGRCHLTGCSDPRLLRASHIKPWKPSTHAERLDPYNGLLLSPNLDLAFDRGLISFGSDGQVILSPQLDAQDAAGLGIMPSLRLKLHERNLPFTDYHRKWVFKK